MELQEVAWRSPPFLTSGGLRSRWIRRRRAAASPMHVFFQMPMLHSLKIQQLKNLNFMHKSRVQSTWTGVSAIRNTGLCNVTWTVEADVTDDMLLYVTGDPVALGCWNHEMAIPLSLSPGKINSWKTETKVPFGINFKYNYFIKGKSKASNDLLWRAGPEFSLSIPFPNKQSQNIIVRDLWLETLKDSADSMFNQWAVDAETSGSSAQVLMIEGYNESCAGGLTLLQSGNDTVDKDMLSIDHLTCNGGCHVGKNISIKDVDSAKSFSEREQPVEEPWFFRYILPTSTSLDINNDMSGKGEVNQIEVSGDKHQSLVKLLPANEQKVVHVGDIISTVILINSSVCTMQRIAILEDGKLVELLLDPVKNNVQCDSIYLGVVTKLVPHMGGAFVDIGISRPSLMDIKQNREPFAYPIFSSRNKGKQVNETIKTEQSEHVDVDEYVSLDNNPDADFLEAGNEDGFINEDFESHEYEDVIDVTDSNRLNMKNGIGESVGSEIELEVDYEESGHHRESESVEDLTEFDSSDLTSNGSRDHQNIFSRKDKWASVRKGTKIIVQVVKEGLGTKGPALTAYPNLRSRFWILISRCNRIGVSKKIIGAERTRLRVIAKSLQPPGFGLTVRTVAAGHSLEELQKDLDGLLSTWKDIVEQAKSAVLAADEGVEGAIPVILHRAMSQTLCVVQDYFNDKVKSMIVDSPRTYHQVSNYLQEIAPDLCDRVLLYNKGTPIFDDYGIEEEINNILSKRVPLCNGGSLVIEQTEALVSIDVNGGHGMLGQGTSQERAVLDVNLAAAKQIARELRLRDIGGIIVVDFIDMDDESNKRLVYEEIKRAVERDKSIVKVSELSRHGLMEITRKRVRPSVSFLISEPCTCCHGTGRVEALETSFSKIEREICRLLATSDQIADPENAKSWPKFILKVDRYMCNYLTSGKRTRLAILSSSLKVWILLKVARGFNRGGFEVKPFADDKGNHEEPITISRLKSAEARAYIPNSKLTLFPIKKWKTRGR